MKRLILVLSLVSLATPAIAAKSAPNARTALMTEAKALVDALDPAEVLEIKAISDGTKDTAYVFGDFNGDKKTDCAVYVKGPDDTAGLVIVHGGTQKAYALGKAVMGDELPQVTEVPDAIVGALDTWYVEKTKAGKSVLFISEEGIEQKIEWSAKSKTYKLDIVSVID